METSSSAVKRKKRKTKKCLNEIRKRSRRNTNDQLLEQSSLVNHGKATTYNGTKTNICITSNRLTLSMLPKVIRSETITRPILSEISEDPVMNFEKIIKNAKSTNNNPTNDYKLNEPSHSDSDYIKYSEDNSISSTCEQFSAAGHMSNHKDSDSGNLSTQENNSARSLLLFSPVGQREDSELYEVSPETLSTTSTSRSTHASYGYQLYEEFMSEIPVYLKQNTPALVKDDVMKKTKSLLHKIHQESCRRESEENLSNSMRESLGNTKNQAIESPPKYQCMSRSPAELKCRSKYATNPQTMYEEVNHSVYEKLVHRTLYDKSENHSLYNKGDHLPLYDKPGSHSRYVKSDYHTLYDKCDHHSVYDQSAHHSMCEKGDHLTLYDKSDRHSMYEIGNQTMLDNKYETPDYTYYPHKLNQ